MNTCPTCRDYMTKRGHIIARWLTARVSGLPEFERRMTAFLRGVHDRHLSGKSLRVT